MTISKSRLSAPSFSQATGTDFHSMITTALLLVILTLVVGCNIGTRNEPNPATSSSSNSNSESQQGAILTSPSTSPFVTQSDFSTASFRQGGIWVTGTGKVSINPDVAILKLGVEVKSETIETAQNRAASAMTKIMASLVSLSILEKDIQTSYYSISPQYIYVEIRENGQSYHKQVLDGYRVSNTVTVNIKDIDSAGRIVDGVVEAGGDLIRIQNIQFTLTDSSEASSTARRIAVLDAIKKADQFAELTGVSKGELIFISETNGQVPSGREFQRMDAMASTDSFSTPISAGEIEVAISVDAIFAIR